LPDDSVSGVRFAVSGRIVYRKQFTENRKPLTANRTTGFTLVEVAVVITIIALLAAFSIPQLSRMRANARDTRRIADLRTIRNALNMYYATYGYYPKVTDWATSGPTDWDNGTKWAQLQTTLSPYLGGGTLPVDPLNTGSTGPWYDNNYHYDYGAYTDGSEYDLMCQLEGKNNENTCKYKCWHWHKGDIWRGGGTSPEQPLCNPCSGGLGYSQYLYVDH